MIPIMIYILIFLTGLLTKFTDNLVDERNSLNPGIKYFTGLVYGLLVGYLFSLDPALATVIAAVITGNLFFGRIDQKPHQLGLAATFLVILFLGIPMIEPAFLILLALFAWIDEFLNERSDRTKASGPALWLGRKRITLELAALGLSLYTLNPAYFLSILLFDISYILADKAMLRTGIIQK
jgi:hypothetical protein